MMKRLNMPGIALLTIDLQNDFVGNGQGRVEGTAECPPMVARLLRSFRDAAAPIIHVVRLYEPDGSNAEPFRRPLIREGGPLVAPNSVGAALPPALAVAAAPDPIRLYAGELQSVGDAEWLMYKPRWDAFHGTPLETHLRRLGVETLVVCGCNLPNCPRATLFGASNRDFRTILVEDATSQVTAERLADLVLMGTEVSAASDVLAMLAV
jgi:nicotinamidase-related amidase